MQARGTHARGQAEREGRHQPVEGLADGAGVDRRPGDEAEEGRLRGPRSEARFALRQVGDEARPEAWAKGYEAALAELGQPDDEQPPLQVDVGGGETRDLADVDLER